MAPTVKRRISFDSKFQSCLNENFQEYTVEDHEKWLIGEFFYTQKFPGQEIILAYRDLTDRLANIQVQSVELNENFDEMKNGKSQIGNDVCRTRELQLEIQEQLISEKRKGSFFVEKHFLFL